MRGRRGAWRHLSSFHVAGVALGDVSRGRRGTWRHLPSFCMAGVLQVALGVALGPRWSRLVAGDAAALCVAGVALGDIYLRFAWQACYSLQLVARLVAVGRRCSPVTLRHFAWQGWHLETSTFVLRGTPDCAWWHAWSPLVAVGRRWSPLVAGDAATLCVAGVTLGDIYLRFARQARYRLHLVARLVALGRRWSPLVGVGRWRCRGTLQGRRGTWRHLPSFCVAGVLQVALGGALGRRWSPWYHGHL